MPVLDDFGREKNDPGTAQRNDVLELMEGRNGSRPLYLPTGWNDQKWGKPAGVSMNLVQKNTESDETREGALQA